jgi:DNA-binding response OmpR family regulator
MNHGRPAETAELDRVHVLVVEDDEHVAGALVSVLSRHGFEVTRAADGRSALHLIHPHTDVVLLDLGLPDMDGYEVCRRMRLVSDAPVIMVTARSQITARIHGLALGADDYVVKPYDLREVVARIEAVMRRRGHGSNSASPDEPVVVRGVQVDLEGREVRLPNGTTVPLTRKEFDVLALLVRHRGAVVGRERILAEVWGSDWKGLGRTLEVHVASLRRKLGEHDLVVTVRGVGYRLALGE